MTPAESLEMLQVFITLHREGSDDKISEMISEMSREEVVQLLGSAIGAISGLFNDDEWKKVALAVATYLATRESE